MNSTTLTGALLETYQAILTHPPVRDVEWGAVRPLLEALGTVAVESNGNLAVTRNGHLLTLHPAWTRTVAESGEMEELRRFLRESEGTHVGWQGRDPQLLLVVNGSESQVYRCQVIGGVPQLILPYVAEPPARVPSGHKRRTPPAAPSPRENEAYARVADLLQVAGQIVVLGVGAGSEASAFVAWLQRHDSDLRSRIIDAVAVDEQHLATVGLLGVAREFYATTNPPSQESAAAHPGERQWSAPRTRRSTTPLPIRPAYGQPDAPGR